MHATEVSPPQGQTQAQLFYRLFRNRRDWGMNSLALWFTQLCYSFERSFCSLLWMVFLQQQAMCLYQCRLKLAWWASPLKPTWGWAVSVSPTPHKRDAPVHHLSSPSTDCPVALYLFCTREPRTDRSNPSVAVVLSRIASLNLLATLLMQLRIPLALFAARGMLLALL